LTNDTSELTLNNNNSNDDDEDDEFIDKGWWKENCSTLLQSFVDQG
jgi:hypothetical protein